MKKTPSKLSSLVLLAIFFINGLSISYGQSTSYRQSTSNGQAISYEQDLSYLDRLPSTQLNVTLPSSNVTGTPGSMEVQLPTCLQTKSENIRQRIVDLATQEWAYFGLNIQDQSLRQTQIPNPSGQRWRTYPKLNVEESARVADTIAGYWSATFNGSWIVGAQNKAWNSDDGVGARWRNPWSAAFISWIMCESGLKEQTVFKRAIAHHSYIDQAIMAEEEQDADAAYFAYNIGDQPMEPGDLLCRGARPLYYSIEQRRQQIGEGARTHCDIVVKADQDTKQILAIGGNVRASVRLKVFNAVTSTKGHLSPNPDDRRPIFAHLKLNADSIELNAIDHTPSMQALVCSAVNVSEAVTDLGLPDTSLHSQC